jgi:ribosomal protein L11 methyltransferase
VEDPALIDGLEGDPAPDLVRPAGCAVRGYLPAGDQRRRRELLAGLSELTPRPRVVTSFCRSSDWDGAWKKYYHVHRVGRRLVVVPAWESYAPASGEVAARLDPGPAFGTGTHPSTELCLELLEDLDPAGGEVADVGTGSGILAIFAALLGAARVAAVDVDEVAVRWAAQNAALNAVGIEFHAGAFLGPLGDRTFDLVTANLTADLLELGAPFWRAGLRDGGRLIAGGIIAGRAAGTRDMLRRAGLAVLREKVRGEWTALVAGRS